MSLPPTPSAFAPHVENRGAESPFLLVCEHASNAFPDQWGDLGLTGDQRVAHIAWDPGALALSRALALRLRAALVHAPVSRLIYDLNRAPDRDDAMAARSECHDIPGNLGLTAESRQQRTEALYLPFHTGLQAEIAHRLAQRKPTVLVTIHSFTPVYNGRSRAVEFGVIHDDDDRLAKAIVTQAQAQTDLKTELNAPYSAADGVTHTLRLHAAPYGLAHAMLEIRNDLLVTSEQVDQMADRLAPVLHDALQAIAKE